MKYRVFRATGTGAAPGGNIDETLAPGVAFQIEEIRLHLSGDGGANIFTVTLDSDAHAAAYDTLLVSQNTNGMTDFVYQPDRPHMFSAGDALDFAWTNGNAETWGLEVYYSAI